MFKRRESVLYVLLYFFFSCSLLFALNLSEEGEKIRIQTEKFSFVLTNRGIIESIKPSFSKKEITTNLSLTAVECGEQRQFQKTYARSPVVENQKDAVSSGYKIKEKGESSIIISYSWENRLIKTEEVFLIKEPLDYIDINYIVTSKMPLAELYTQISSNDFSPGTLFYPEEKRFGSNSNMGYFSLVPGYVFAYDPAIKGGVGFLVDRTDNLRAFRHLQRGKPEGFGGPNYLSAGVYSKALRWEPVGKEISFNVKLLIGTIEEITGICKELLPVEKKVAIEKVWPEKLIYWSDEEGKGSVVLKNNTQDKEEVEVRVYIRGKKEESIFKEKVALLPEEKKEITVSWLNKDREYGYELYAEVLKGKEVIDSGREYFAVADQFSKVGHINVFNPGWMNKEGQETYMIPHLRDNYQGIIEYYCWMPDEIYDLTPDTEVFEPHTESQGAYRATITRKFIKDLVDFANKNGIRVVTLESGFASLRGALKHPEEMKYSQDGQILLYNGKIYEKERFAVVPANIYTEDAVRRYAQEMVASTDMFNWNGVRFDWGFIPVVPPDPLDINASQQVWYNFEGVPADKIFTDPDNTGARLLTLWRGVVNSKHPRFEYMTNCGLTEETVRKFPKYVDVATTKSGVLFEFLLDYTKDDMNTWEKWANALVSSAQIARKNGGQPSVGWMRGYAPGGITHRLLHYITFSSGVHWYGPVGPRYSIDDTWKRFAYSLRFSEYFYDPGFKRLPEGSVSVEGADRILWKPFVYGRELDGKKREVAVHILNLPQSDYISMHHEIPEVKRGITVKAGLKAGEKCEKVTILLPDPYPHTEQLKFRIEGRDLIIEVPEIREAGVVVAEIGGGR